MKEKADNRRQFIEAGLKTILGAGVMAGLSGKAMAEGKKVKLLGQDGRLVEVDEDVLKRAQAKKASHTDIKNWIDHRDKLTSK